MNANTPFKQNEWCISFLFSLQSFVLAYLRQISMLFRNNKYSIFCILSAKKHHWCTFCNIWTCFTVALERMQLSHKKEEQIEAYHLDDHVADLLQEHDDASWGVIEPGVSPDQTHRVQHGAQQGNALIKLRLLEVLKMVTERFQVHVDVLSLCQCCNNVRHRI